MNKIEDQFSNLKISRQRKYQLRKKAAGQCTLCGDPTNLSDSLCDPHLNALAERRRAEKGLKPWKEGGRGRRPLSAGKKDLCP